MTTMLETLNETAAAYTSTTRAVLDNGNCAYQTPEGRQCPVGRCMIDPLGSLNVSCAGLDQRPGGLDVLLKPEYRGYLIDFWIGLQRLHDNSAYWDLWGLSPSGLLLADLIRETYCHDNDA